MSAHFFQSATYLIPPDNVSNQISHRAKTQFATRTRSYTKDADDSRNKKKLGVPVRAISLSALRACICTFDVSTLAVDHTFACLTCDSIDILTAETLRRRANGVGGRLAVCRRRLTPTPPLTGPPSRILAKTRTDVFRFL